MLSFVTALHVVLCVFMVVVVLLQTGKSDMGAAFGGASQTVFGAGGAVSFLGKVTTATAVLFMCTSIYLAYSSNRAVRSGSVLEGLEAELEDAAVPSSDETGTTEPVSEATPGAPASAEPAAEGSESAPAAPSAAEAPVEGDPPAEDVTPTAP